MTRKHKRPPTNLLLNGYCTKKYIPSKNTGGVLMLHYLGDNYRLLNAIKFFGIFVSFARVAAIFTNDRNS